MRASTTQPASTGVATARTAETTESTRKAISALRCGRAKTAMRRNVALVKRRRDCSPCMALSSAIQWLNPISITVASEPLCTGSCPLSAGPTVDVKTSSSLEVKGSAGAGADAAFGRMKKFSGSPHRPFRRREMNESHDNRPPDPKEAIMATGISLFFLAVGAILTFAVDTTVSGIDLDTIGVILMVIGLLGMLFSLVLWDSWSPRPLPR